MYDCPRTICASAAAPARVTSIDRESDLQKRAISCASAYVQALRALVEQLGLKAGQLFGTLRVAATAPTVAPPLFETLAGAYRGGQGCAAMIAILG